jgi:hypothetical protein
VSAAPRGSPGSEPWIFLVDRSLGGKSLADALRALGDRVEVHDDHFPKDATDEVWLADVGAKGWVILSKDDRIRRNRSSDRPSSLRASLRSSSDGAISAATRLRPLSAQPWWR